MIEVAAIPWGPLVLYSLTAVAAFATLKAVTAADRDRLTKHIELDEVTQDRVSESLSRLNVGVARLEEKVDFLRDELREQKDSKR